MVQLVPLKLEIGDVEIKETVEIKFLGVLVHKNFRFQGHFEKVLDKVKKGVNALIRAKFILNYQAKINIYHSLIHSHINYCCLSWISKISSKQMKQLATLQKRALRAVFNAKYNSHSNILFYLKVESPKLKISLKRNHYFLCTDLKKIYFLLLLAKPLKVLLRWTSHSHFVRHDWLLE